ncbi:hypothetical protein [Desulfallas thermosapovorans]|uniref:Uncharacterized protein n=1 Tax=Desulfallas thermosapovorans DSM 6562 TaxID=1121431 RepID=A0A5S4ZVX1_9FIRM|nr:hypothetical protein [Desulfallas thermosapovorans]TYO96925.1 hypothetical protein LX24_00735 [Desulfallas thermosapovorans DSM 6562]
MRKLLGVVALALLLVTGLVINAQAQGTPPVLPALCYGEVYINGEPAPVGTEVIAKVDNDVVATILITERGWFGGPGLKTKLPVVGNDLSGKIVEFYVSGTVRGQRFDNVKAGQVEYWGNGEVKQLSLSAEVAIKPAPSTGDGGSSGGGGNGGESKLPPASQTLVPSMLSDYVKTEADAQINNVFAKTG